MTHLWYKNAIFYSLDAETFYDADGDGTGDLKGLIERLDYIASLGVTCIWLQPFYPSPDRDSGYDVTDYCGVDPVLGNSGDFAEFMDKADALGLRVIVDLVVNHTSREHHWFQAARRSRASRYRDFYIWSDEPQAFTDEQLSFKGEEASIWSWDEAAGQYYLHFFYKEQPDLNISNPLVREEILRIMGYWLRLGVSGFRVDAVEFLVEPYGTEETKSTLTAFLTTMRDVLSQRSCDAVLLAETNVGPDKLPVYVNGGHRMQMGFNFYINQHLFLAMARADSRPLRKALQELPAIAPCNQLLNFLRQHDELSLKLLDKEEKAAVLAAFAPEPEARIFEDNGIRRRLPPMLGGDRRRIELAYSLAFSLPGTPMLRYGDEIGMGDDLRLEGRHSVRTPMQWSESRNGGFSLRDDHLPKHPVIRTGPYGYRTVNVCSAQRDPGSLLSWMERLIIMRKRLPHIGLGRLELLPAPADAVLIHVMHWEGDRLLFVHNLGPEALELSSGVLGGQPLIPLFHDTGSALAAEALHISAYGYCWLRTDNGK